MKRTLFFKKTWQLVVVALMLSITITNAQTVDSTGVFDTPITGEEIIHAKLIFYDVNADGAFDASFVLSQPEITTWGDYSASLAFYNPFQIRDGGGFYNDNDVSLVPGQLYDVWFDVNVNTLTYRVYVQTEGMELPVQILNHDAAFRNQAITSIDRWSTLHNANSQPDTVQVVSISIGDVPDGYDDPSLSSLTVSEGTLDPEFFWEDTDYELVVPFGTEEVEISAVANGLGASVSGDVGIVQLVDGGYYATILVTAGNGVMAEYYIDITEDAGEVDASLSSIVSSVGLIDPGVERGITEFKLVVPQGTTTVDLTATTTVPEATITGGATKTVTLTNGTGSAVFEVTAKDGNTKESYTVLVSETDSNYGLYLEGGNGSTSNVDISGLNLQTLPFTIEMWIKPDGIQPHNAGLIYNRPGGANGYGLQYASSWWLTPNSIRFMAEGGQVTADTTTVGPAAPGAWNHLAVVMTETTRTVYLNGVPRKEESTFSNIDWSLDKLYLGWDDNNNSKAFKGIIDEVRIWNTVRDSSTIVENLYTTYNGDEDGMVGYWNFDLPHSTHAVDLSGDKLNGLIKGGDFVTSTLASNNATLASISLEYGGVIAITDPSLFEYEVIVPVGTDSIGISAAAFNAFADVVLSTDTVVLTSGVGSASIVVTSADESESNTYAVNFKEYDGSLTLKHGYNFWSGTAEDRIGGADGIVNGGSIGDGAFTSTTEGDYITLPGDQLNLAGYPAITLEAFITTRGENIGKYTMLAYFGGLNGAGSLWIQPTRKDGTQTSRTEASGNTASGFEADTIGGTYHIVSVLTNDSIYFYINGELQEKNIATDQIRNISPENAWLGESGWPDPTWLGSIHDFNIYSGNMDSTTVETRYLDYLQSVSVDEVKADKVAIVYPTVTSGEFNVKFVGKPGTITVYNLAGNVVVKQQASSAIETIFVSEAGLYILQIECEGATEIVKVVKTN